ncbi:DUF2235 domain-containing protein [Tahibacter caeni]|uniref:DUF2235 domain-containing protein n=1 Tax=Tahibacter caeni TaxID=1453545 RepID=UPI002148A89C|nr:DUF2235 domain-containing protein [Tahibacter caeni]
MGVVNPTRERLVLCFDGTWNSLASHTNVSNLYAQIADETCGLASQRKFYDEGVGTGQFDRIRGGAFGMGMDRNIRTGYAWLATQFTAQPTPVRSPAPAPVAAASCATRPATGIQRLANGDLPSTPQPREGLEFVTGPDIFLFGFSRGAFTARSLAGLINFLGIPRQLGRNRKAASLALADDPQIRDAWELYRTRPKPGARLTDTYAKRLDAFRQNCHYPVRIHFVGVWDTVGALGIPRVFDEDWLWRFSNRYEFHDTRLGAGVRNAFHALAIDEHRLPYTPALWTDAAPTTEAVEQRWFPGAHADVGGGYENCLLPAPPLKWIADRAAECGLEFLNDRRTAVAGQIPPSLAQAPASFELDGREHLSPVHDSYASFLGGTYKAMRSLPFVGGGPVYRRMLVRLDGINQTVDPTAFAKWRADDDYRPPNLAQAGRTDVSFNAVSDPAPDGKNYVVSAGAV